MGLESPIELAEFNISLVSHAYNRRKLARSRIEVLPIPKSRCQIPVTLDVALLGCDVPPAHDAITSSELPVLADSPQSFLAVQ